MRTPPGNGSRITPHSGTNMRDAAIGSLLGTTLEWIDWLMFTTMAALVFNDVFFPELSPLMGTFAALATFAIGFLTRPVGAMIFGHFGDRIGRRASLVTTMLIMGGTTFAIGLLPTYAMVGSWGAVLLLLLRLAQGLAVGGEWGGAVLMCVEHSSKDRRGLNGTWPQLGVPLGLLLSTGLIALVTMMPEEDLTTWGWRIPFLVSIVVMVLGLVIRMRIEETPVFRKSHEQQKSKAASAPLRDVFKDNPRRILLAMGTRLSETNTSNIYAVFAIVFVTEHAGMSRSQAVIATALAAAVTLATLPLAGHLTDRYGRRPVYMFGAGFSAVFAIPAFLLLDTGTMWVVSLALIVAMGLGWAFMYGAQAAFYSELFPTRYRYTAIGFVYSVGAIPTGALAAMTATAVLAWSNNASWMIGAYVGIVAVISLVCTAALPETHTRRAVRGAGQAEGERPGGHEELTPVGFAGPVEA